MIDAILDRMIDAILDRWTLVGDRWYAFRCPAGNGPRTWRCPSVCPCCEGECGFTEHVDEWGGPHYPCGYCDSSGVVSLRARMLWWSYGSRVGKWFWRLFERLEERRQVNDMTKDTLRWIVALAALVAALTLVGCRGNATAGPIGSAWPTEDLTAAGWQATGMCAPAVVTPAMLAVWFASVDGTIRVEVGASTVSFGHYVVSVDVAQRSVSVVGPPGADVLERDIAACVGSGPMPDDRAGRWIDGMYTDEAIEPAVPGEQPRA